MISAKRIVTVFRQGSSGQFTRTTNELTDEQLSAVRHVSGDEPPLIASVRSKDEWFVLTKSRFLLKDGGPLHTIRLDQVEGLAQTIDAGNFAQGKLHGGELKIQVKGGSTLAVRAESGEVYTALVNVFLYLARVNRTTSSHAPTDSPTTIDHRPTTAP